MTSLIPHYIIQHDFMSNHDKMLTELMSGTNNQKEWYHNMGLEITRHHIYGGILAQDMTIHPPSRYDNLFKAADYNHDFWAYLASCIRLENKVILYNLCLIYHGKFFYSFVGRKPTIWKYKL